jgi:hypothetical protein
MLWVDMSHSCCNCLTRPLQWLLALLLLRQCLHQFTLLLRLFLGVVAGCVWSSGGGTLSLRWRLWSSLISNCQSRQGELLVWFGDCGGGSGVVDDEAAWSTSISVLLHWTLLVMVSYRVNVVLSSDTSGFKFFAFLFIVSTLIIAYLALSIGTSSRRDKFGFTLALSQPPFDSLLQ